MLIPESGEDITNFFMKVVNVLTDNIHTFRFLDEAAKQDLQEILDEWIQEFDEVIEIITARYRFLDVSVVTSFYSEQSRV